jgi:hypothetical protein
LCGGHSLARISGDPVLKQRYQELALEFAQNAGDERDLDINGPPLASNKPKPAGSNVSPNK